MMKSKEKELSPARLEAPMLTSQASTVTFAPTVPLPLDTS